MFTKPDENFRNFTSQSKRDHDSGAEIIIKTGINVKVTDKRI